MKEIKKSASFTSKQRGKDVKFNIDLNYSPEYDSFIIKVKEGEGFMSYTSSIERMPLEVIQKLNEMLEEVLMKAGSEYEMKEHKMFNGGKVDSKLTESEVEKIAEATAKALGSKFSVTEGTIDNGSFDLDYDGVKFDGGSYLVLDNGDVKNVAIPEKPIVYNYKTKKKFEFGGDFQAGVYNKGGAVKNERLHVNKDEDYEVRYSKPRPHRKGYKGLRNFDEGGEMDLTDDKRLRVRKPVMPERKMSEQEWAEKHNPRAYEYMTKRKMATGGGVGLIGNQKRIDMNKNGKIDAEDFKLLRSSMNGAWRNERKHVNHNEDYEVRYARKKPARTGYKGKRNFATGGGVDSIVDKKADEFIKNLKDRGISATKRVSKNGIFIYGEKNQYGKYKYETYLSYSEVPNDDFLEMEMSEFLRLHKKMATGGGVSKFKMLSDKVARNYEGKRVKPQYQKEYGKVYSKSEAKEVGDKVAGKVKAMQKMNTGGATKKGGKGGIMVLAKKIRKDGEKWTDAVKRAGQQLK
jgi:hypothetical protein